MHSANNSRHHKSEQSEGYVNISGRDYSVHSLTSSAGFLFRAAYLQIRDLLRTAEQFDVKPAMFELLRVTNENPGIRQAHAARLLLIQESNMARLVRDAFEMGVIGRLDEEGKQRQGLWLSPRGKEILREMMELAEAVEEQYMAVLTHAESSSLGLLLGRVYKAALCQKIETELEAPDKDIAEDI